MRRFCMVHLIAITVLLGCSTPDPFGGVDDDDAGGDDDVGGDDDGQGDDDVEEISCPTELPGPVLVAVGGLVIPFCIDATEVTQAQYEVFVQSSPSGNTHASCGWNESVEPDLIIGSCTEEHYTPVETPDLPVACVDWCDAHAYCQWAGKQLCGPVTFESEIEALWYAACSSAGEYSYPYGNMYTPGLCNDEEAGLGAVAEVGSFDSCRAAESPWSSLVDMSGNVSEWVDDCEDSGPTAYCQIAGGSFTTISANENGEHGFLTCGKVSSEAISRQISGNRSVGFRCCLVP